MNTSSKRIVINKQKKSKLNSSLVVPKHNKASVAASSTSDHLLRNELNYYRQQNQQNLIKVKFLLQKLESHGEKDIPDKILKETSEIDKKIKKVQDLLFFKKNKQMTKLKTKIVEFLRKIEYEVEDSVLSPVNDEVQLIFLILELFQERYQEFVDEKKQIQTKFSPQAWNRLRQETKSAKQQIQRLISYSKDLQIELFMIRKQQHENKSMTSKNSSRVYDQNMKALEEDNHHMRMRLTEVERQLKYVNEDFQNNRLKVEEKDRLISQWKKKHEQISNQIERDQLIDNKWRDRYMVMEKQKNQRIRMLEEQLYAPTFLENSNSQYYDL